MKIQRVQLNSSEVRKLLRGEGQYIGVRNDLEARARRMQAAAGPGFAVDVQVGANRARGEVFTLGGIGRKAEARSRALTRSVDAGRG